MRVSSKVRGKSPMLDRWSGRHGRRRFLGMGEGEGRRRRMNMRLRLGSWWGSGGDGEGGVGVAVVGSWGNRCRCVQT